jgi:hypothetical protein
MGDVARSRVLRLTLLFTAPAARTLEAERMLCADEGRLCALMPLCADDGRLCALSKPRASIDWRQATRVEVGRHMINDKKKNTGSDIISWREGLRPSSRGPCWPRRAWPPSHPIGEHGGTEPERVHVTGPR